MDCTEYLKLLCQELFESFNHLPTLGLSSSTVPYSTAIPYGKTQRNSEVTGPEKSLLSLLEI